jgi:hypothetical protein
MTNMTVNAILTSTIAVIEDESEPYCFSSSKLCAVAKLYQETTGLKANVDAASQAWNEEFFPVLVEVCNRLGVEISARREQQWWNLSDFVAEFQTKHKDEGMTERQAAVGVFQAALTT